MACFCRQIPGLIGVLTHLFIANSSCPKRSDIEDVYDNCSNRISTSDERFYRCLSLHRRSPSRSPGNVLGDIALRSTLWDNIRDRDEAMYSLGIIG